MLEDLADPPADFNPACPWDFILAQSAYDMGTTSLSSKWWQLNLVAGLSSTQSTQSVIAKLIGRAPRNTSSFPGKSSSSRGSPPPARVEKPHDKKGKGGRLCNMWNKGRCSKIKCPEGLTHRCSICGQGNHGAQICLKNPNADPAKRPGKFVKKARK